MPFTTPHIRFDSLRDGSFLVLSIPLSFSLCINLANLAAVPVKGDTRLDLVDSDYTGAELLGSQEEMDRGVGG
jgi:hypothetical protein